MAGREHSAPRSASSGSRIGEHYDIVEELGRGGMAVVYRVSDARNGNKLALKQLLPQSDEKHARESALLFEREFHTLAQLAHPRVIAVYDYGVDPAGPFYTMELLDGGDLRERTPLGWRDACELIFDVCSSLALLHSRRLVHRDVSPRNVRCTHDGHAKLIDFGAMVPMGTNAQVVGTPPFVAPEAVYGAALDARTDLFSLGTTLYYTLTGRLAYPARSFAQLIESWSMKPPPPSAIVPDVPPALDALVMALISLEAAPRPRSAFEVMQRLAAVAGIQREEPLSVSRAYLVTPTLIARDSALHSFRDLVSRAQHGRGRGVLVAAPPGLGRTRLLDACALEAKMLGCSVLRLAADSCARHELGVFAALAEQLLSAAPSVALEAAREAQVWDELFEPQAAGEPANDTLPRLRAFLRHGAERSALSSALGKWFTQLTKHGMWLIAVDDVDRSDDGSLALLATLAQRARTSQLLVLATGQQDSAPRLEVLSSRCATLPLRALDLAETEQLLGSVFGDVPNLALLAARIGALSAGSPREIMALAQHLVDRGAIRYDGGTWSLPQQLTAADMPASARDALRERIGQLGPLARRLAEAQALSLDDAFTRDDYALLAPDADAHALDDALDELVALRLLGFEGGEYRLEDRALASELSDALDAASRRERYAALATRGSRSGEHPFAVGRLWLLCGDEARGLELLVGFVRTVRDRVEVVDASRMTPDEAGRTLSLALQACLRLGRPARDAYDIRHWITLLSVAADDALYWEAAPQWRAQLERDSGLCDYWQLSEIADPGQRLMRALTLTAERYAATPEAERVYAPDHAIRLLVHYVVLSIAVGSRTYECALVASLPQLLEPLASLSPLIAAIWQNALATLESIHYRKTERANQRWIDVYERLGQTDGPDPQIVRSIRYAIAYGVGLNEAAMGRDSAMQWAEKLDQDPLQHVNAMYLRKVVRLQQGDLEGAERYRKQAELLALQSSTRQMFTSLLSLEINIHAAAWDLTGLKQLAARVEPLAARHRGWVPFQVLAEAHYRRLLGDHAAADRTYARCLELCAPDEREPMRSVAAWPAAISGRCECLIALGRADEAHALAAQALATAEQREMAASSHEIARALALAEGKRGDYAGATARLERLIEQQRALGVTGLLRGASYEARARVAIWAGDQLAVERYGRLTAEQFRHGRGSTLGARYERLMEEARGAGVLVLPELSPFETTIFGGTEIGSRAHASLTVASAMAGATDSGVRAQRALQLLCEVRGAGAGHLYLAVQGELRLVASSSGAAPDDMLQRLVSDFWSQQSDDTDPDTAMLDEEGPPTQVWTDRKGTAFRPILLHGKLEGMPVTAGVVLLSGDADKADSETDTTLVTELASFFLRTGDSMRPK